MAYIYNEGARKYLERWGDLKNERNTWLSAWKDISDYIYPERERTTRINNRETSSRSKIMDPVATTACNILANGMHGGFTNPTRPWFRVTLNNKDLAEKSLVKTWLYEVQEILYQTLGKSNFYTQVHGLYTDQASFGTAALYCEADDKYDVKFKMFVSGEYALALGANGRVDTLYREYTQTARNLEQDFPDSLPQYVKDLLATNNREEQLKVLHCIQPNEEFDPGRPLDPVAGRPYESVYILLDGEQEFLAKGGYMEQPFMTPRWFTVGNDVYGYSPGMTIMPEIKMLQVIAKNYIEAVHMALRPPLRVPSNFNDQLNLLPGGQNRVDASDPSAIQALYEVRPDLRATAEKIQDLRNQISQTYHTDLFMALSTTDRRQITAEEIIERRSEKLLQLGPVVEREQHELLDPLISRVYGLLERAGKLPPPPDMEELQGQELKIEYTSVLALAQKQSAVQAIQGFTQYVGSVAQFVPGALDKFNADEAVDLFADITGVPPKVVRGEEDVAKIRQQRAAEEAKAQQAQAQAEQASTANQGAQALKTIGELDPEAQGLVAAQEMFS